MPRIKNKVVSYTTVDDFLATKEINVRFVSSVKTE